MSRKSILIASIVATTSLSVCVSHPANAYTSGDAKQTVAAVQAPSDIDAKPFAHPGLLHSEQDFQRMRINVAQGKQPWLQGWQRLIANRHASLGWTPRPQDAVYRGKNPEHAENYSLLFNDAAAAYALALRWKVSGDDAYAGKAIGILNAWSDKLTMIGGNSDKFLASGIYGYELANAAEILRTSPQWQATDFRRFQSMMLTVFYPMNHDFLTRHNGTKGDHYWANWDLANMASMLAIGVLADRRDIYSEAVEYFKHGAGNGSIEHLVWTLYPDGLGQVQESGRDQGHTLLDFALAGAFCQMAWNQGDDLFGYDDNRLLKGAEYAARYNLGQDVPYTSYSDSLATQPVISPGSRGDTRPIWELLYNHYVVLKKLDAPGVAAYAQRVRPEGGGGDYGSTSGGFDQLGYGTLTYTLNGNNPAPTRPNSGPQPE
ncbi:membrane protein [Burkholderia lata]|uniref:Membrane protein n=2 Tax=Burkholderia lata (strain ATCC 17760 / DSM 23089 / LMG 22485 / NCIMB 9086 / R18194 / 383) TaxID=482957 RepID=A0A6P2L531_BURL3|nr:membrane protein [Burkholderia lata]